MAPRLLILLPLAPAAALLAWWLVRRARAARERWAVAASWPRLGLGGREGGRGKGVAFAAGLAVVILATLLGLARPRWGEALIEVERRGVDVVFVLDTSLSMAALDARPSRLAVAQALIREVVRRLPGHRFALLAAEGDGVVLTPLTVDATAIELVVDSLRPGTLPTPGTSLAAALAGAIELFPEAGGGRRIAVVLSDGEDHEGGLERATERLRAAGVVVHAVGIGTAQGAPIPLATDPMRPRAAADLKRDLEGRVVITRRNDAALRAIAEGTGGLFLTAESAGLDPAPLVARIDALERHGFETETLAARPERFQWPLALAAAALVAMLWGGRSPRSLPQTAGSPATVGARVTARAVARLALLLLAAGAAMAAAPPPWAERWLHNPFERTRQGVARFEEGDAIAAEDFDAALRLAPEDPRLLFNAGTARLDTDPAEAARLLGRAVELGEKSGTKSGSGTGAADTWFNLGAAHLRLGDSAAAAEAFRQVLRRQPERYGAKHNLELALRQLARAEPKAERQPGSAEGAERADGEPPPSPSEADPDSLEGGGQPDEERAGAMPSNEPADEPRQAGSEPSVPDPSAADEPPGAEEGEPSGAGPTAAEQPPPRFRPQPEMSAQQANELLDAIEQLERERRRDEAARRRQRSGARGGGKDW